MIYIIYYLTVRVYSTNNNTHNIHIKLFSKIIKTYRVGNNASLEKYYTSVYR